jgi:hypothetical protein
MDMGLPLIKITAFEILDLTTHPFLISVSLGKLIYFDEDGAFCQR